jgi:hypothetical protein
MPLSIERARKDAKALRAAWAEGEKVALKRVKPYFAPDEQPTLTKAQLVVAREQLYESWAQLVHSGGIHQNDIAFAARDGDVDKVRELIAVLKPFELLAVGICINPLRAPEDRVVECVRLLLDAGCNPNAGVLLKGVKYSCLYGALDHGNHKLAALLREYGAELQPDVGVEPGRDRLDVGDDLDHAGQKLG